MPLHKNVLFSTTMKSEISNWCLFVRKWSHSALTCTMNKKCAMMFSWSSKILCQFILASSAPWSGGFFVVFFLSFCLQNFEKSQFFDIASLKQFLSCVSCSTGPVHHPMSSTAANVSFLSHCGVWQKLHANRQFLHCARFVNWFFSENIFANKKLPSSSQMAIRTLWCWSLAWCQWTWLSSHFLGIVSLHVKDTPLKKCAPISNCISNSGSFFERVNLHGKLSAFCTTQDKAEQNNNDDDVALFATTTTQQSTTWGRQLTC